MKTPTRCRPQKSAPALALAALLAAFPLHAQTPPPAAAPAVQQADTQKLSAEDLNDLLGPIALYPDALVALILPASTVPADITIAARYLEQNGDDANVDDQPWDPSVKGLARYPDVLKWMDQNLEWTNSLGEAFVEQPADVMNAVQTLRAEAKDKGNLVNTPQQTVVVEKQTKEIRIVPTEPDVIYVPQYDPQVVYVQPYQPDYVTPLVTFGIGFAAGSWLSYDCDWHNRGIYYGRDCGWNNRSRWSDHGYRDGNVNIVNTTVNNTTINNYSNNSGASRWQASPQSRRVVAERQRQNLGNTRISRANAAVRHPNNTAAVKTAARPAHVPKPTRLNAANHRKAPAVRAPGAAQAARNPGKGPNAKPAQATNKPGKNPGRHAQPATAAPLVNGQPGGKKSAAHKGANKTAGVRKPGSGPNNNNNNKRPASSAPSNPGSSHQAKRPQSATASSQQASKPSGHSKVAKPSAPPQNRPASARPQAQPKPKQQPARSQTHSQPSQPRPQQAKPRPQQQQRPQSSSKPQAHAGGSGQQPQKAQGGNSNKKKKKNND